MSTEIVFAIVYISIPIWLLFTLGCLKFYKDHMTSTSMSVAMSIFDKIVLSVLTFGVNYLSNATNLSKTNMNNLNFEAFQNINKNYQDHEFVKNLQFNPENPENSEYDSDNDSYTDSDDDQSSCSCSYCQSEVSNDIDDIPEDDMLEDNIENDDNIGESNDAPEENDIEGNSDVETDIEHKRE